MVKTRGRSKERERESDPQLCRLLVMDANNLQLSVDEVHTDDVGQLLQ